MINNRRNLSQSKVLIYLTGYFNLSGIPYCIVGNTDDFPNAIKGDVDIIIPQDKMKSLHLIMIAFCKENDFKLVQCLQHENNAFYYVIQWWENNSPAFLKLDICGDYYRKAKLFLKADELLSKPEEAKDVQDHAKGFLVPDAATEFTYYLLKKIDKGNLSNEQVMHLHKQWLKDPMGCLSNVRRFWNNEHSALIKQAAEGNDWQKVIKAIPQLKKFIHQHVRMTLKGITGEFLRRVRRVLFPTGFSVVFLGPDGSGKSSVIDAVSLSLAPAFRKQARYHLRPFVFRARTESNGQPVTNPHASPKYGVIISVMKLFYLWIDYTVGYLISVHWKKIFSTLVIFDRYFHDILIDSLRFRYGGPSWLAALLVRAIPKPDVLFFLNVPADIIQQRKSEISREACDQQTQDYLALAKKIKKSLIVDASQPLNDVVKEVNDSLLHSLAKKTETRLLRMNKWGL